MLCPRCGNPVSGVFCSHCGTPLAPNLPAPPPPSAYAPPPPYTPPPPAYGPPPPYAPNPYARPYSPRVPAHLQTLGVLWCVYGLYRAVAGLFGALLFLGLASSHPFLGRFGGAQLFPFAPYAHWMHALGALIVIVTLFAAGLAFATGFALLARKPWGRTLAIVAAILSLIKIPFGTALGIYTLWVLIPARSAAEYDALVLHPPPPSS